MKKKTKKKTTFICFIFIVKQKYFNFSLNVEA